MTAASKTADSLPRPLRFGLVWTFLLTAAIGLLFTWPLPRHATQAIPGSHARPPGQAPMRYMLPGDHLQLLYHFWLGSDMAAGRTPLFYNIYEMNEGDDTARYEPGAYYAPFSLLFGLFSLFGSLALAWNLSGFLSLWITAYLTWRLAGRYTSDPWAALAAAATAVALPYRWASLLGGSPTGFAMAWVPLLWLGIDDAVRRDRVTGGLWAGLALLLSGAGDAHVFFFAALSTPAWAAIALAADPRGLRGLGIGLPRKLAAAGLVAIGAATGYLILRWTAASIGETAVAAGRTWEEIVGFSPSPRGFFSRHALGVSDHVALGWVAPVLAAAALATLAWRARGSARKLAFPILLGMLALGILLLALGTNGPFGGAPLNMARILLPPYRFIRQPAKVFALLPSLLAVVLAAGWRAWFPDGARRAAWVVLALIVADYATFMRPDLCTLPDRQSAYAAVAREAHEAGAVPRAVVLPLWPGDSHYAANYQIYAMLYRIRLLNVYRPMVPQSYVENVFEPFESLNQGALTDAQADALLARGITHVMLHEDLFPEQVSPFPVRLTLQALREHPRLAFTTREGPVWAFRLLEDGAHPPAMPSPTETAFPAWRWTAARETLEGGAALLPGPPGAAPGVRLDGAGQAIRFNRPVRVAAYPNLKLWVRARGRGLLRLDTGRPEAATETWIDTEAWAWTELAFDVPDLYAVITPRLSAPEGQVELQSMMLGVGAVPHPLPGSTLTWPAAAFFRAGHTGEDGRTVTLLRDREASWPVFYGPRLPLPAGTYTVRWRFSSPAEHGTEVARFQAMSGVDPCLDWVSIRAGYPAEATFIQIEASPLTFELEFHRVADLVIEQIDLFRHPDIKDSPKKGVPAP